MNDGHVTLKVLEMALKRRCPEPGLLHRSDQGCTYASGDYHTAPASETDDLNQRLERGQRREAQHTAVGIGRVWS